MQKKTAQKARKRHFMAERRVLSVPAGPTRMEKFRIDKRF